MENIIASTLFVFAIFAAYCVASRPSKKTPQPASVGVVSLPDSIQDESIVQPDSPPDMPITSEEVETAYTVKEYPITKHFTVNNSQAGSVAALSATELSGLTIRQLKQLASQKKIKRYGRMTKAELIAALS